MPSTLGLYPPARIRSLRGSSSCLTAQPLAHHAHGLWIGVDQHVAAIERGGDGAEKTGYPTQKPEGIVRRMLQASTRPGDWCLDFFAGSGTLGAVAAKLGRRYVMIDSNPEAVRVMRRRLGAQPSRIAAAAPIG